VLVTAGGAGEVFAGLCPRHQTALRTCLPVHLHFCRQLPTLLILPGWRDGSMLSRQPRFAGGVTWFTSVSLFAEEAPVQPCAASTLGGSCPASRAWRLARHLDNPALINSPTTTRVITPISAFVPIFPTSLAISSPSRYEIPT